jgi:hypothetical protein
MLARSDLPLSAVALATGFSNQSHLAHLFRQLVGTTRRQFRWSQRWSGTVPAVFAWQAMSTRNGQPRAEPGAKASARAAALVSASKIAAGQSAGN